MSAQELGVVVIVGCALAYLVWKIGGAGRGRRKRGGPDVRVSALTRKRDDDSSR